MSASSGGETEILIVGAGPTGLVLALWLTRLGTRVRIVDKTAEPGTTSRALAVQARTLEFYRQIGIDEEVVERGRRVVAANLWVAGKHSAHAVLGAMGKGISPYAYALVYPQDEHEQLLVGHLAEAGIEVERRAELTAFEDRGDRIVARLKRADGGVETCEARYIAGCDGANSTVRNALNIGFPGGTYNHLFYVADVNARGPVMNGELHVALDLTDFLAVFPLRDDGCARLVGTVRQEAEHQRDNLTWNDVSKRVIESLKIEVERVNWFSTYHVHHRVAHQFARGRAFILGDAAHIHSPVGGQGMNTGIGDAINLAWKLAAVVKGHAKESILESYEPERIAFARRLVATTDRGFTGVTSDGTIARVVRLDVVPLVMPLAFRITPLRRAFFRTVSQTDVNYRGSALSEGRANLVFGGDRLPWVPMDAASDADNFTPLKSIDWQVHVYGGADQEVHSMCEQRKIALHEFPWRREMIWAGLERDAVYLVRPDGYVALARAGDAAAALASYLDTRGITTRGSS
jgi:2-polyprenyl-6-methoxyphenol hydroxylase-like FAD-dependent oxidoreductase